VGNPAHKKIADGSARQIGGAYAGSAEEIARMVDSRENHDDAANNIDRFDVDSRAAQVQSRRRSAD